MKLKAAAKILATGALVIGGLLIAGLLWLSRSYSVPPGQTVFQVIPGIWTWADEHDGCHADPQTIAVSADHRTMTFHRNRAFKGANGNVDSVTAYDIISHDRSRIRARIPGEQRTTAAGAPVVWDLVLRSPNRFAWHRTDWLWFDFTGDIVRCVNDSTAAPNGAPSHSLRLGERASEAGLPNPRLHPTALTLLRKVVVVHRRRRVQRMSVHAAGR
jgi:hypothetical protein